MRVSDLIGGFADALLRIRVPHLSGYYELQLDGKTEKLLALYHDNEESKMDFYTPEELRTFFAGQKNITIFDNLLDGDFVKTFQESNVGTPLWKYCVMLALAFLLIEILLIRFMKGKRW